jgi:hypothetical protein
VHVVPDDACVWCLNAMLFQSDVILSSMHSTCWTLISRPTNLQRDLRSKLEAGVCVYLCVHVYQYGYLYVHVHVDLVAPLSYQGRAPCAALHVKERQVSSLMEMNARLSADLYVNTSASSPQTLGGVASSSKGLYSSQREGARSGSGGSAGAGFNGMNAIGLGLGGSISQSNLGAGGGSGARGGLGLGSGAGAGAGQQLSCLVLWCVCGRRPQLSYPSLATCTTCNNKGTCL